MITIDGSLGEGGGQVLRTTLALALATGEPVRIDNIRAGRPRPGLMRQHLTALRAATTISNARVEGDAVGSTNVTFRPAAVRGGDYQFAVGTAGSTTLVLQTILLALATANQASTVLLEGGTHNPMAPPFEFLQRCFLPQLERLGPRVAVSLERAGFAPAGGGKIVATIEPAPLRGDDTLLDAGPIEARRATAVLSNLPDHIGRRELDRALHELSWPTEAGQLLQVPSAGPGNVLFLEVERPHVREIVSAFGESGVSAERVAHQAVRDLRRYLVANVPVGEHLADQLILPLALAGSGTFRTLPLSRHASTQVALVQQILGARVAVERLSPAITEVCIG